MKEVFVCELMKLKRSYFILLNFITPMLLVGILASILFFRSGLILNPTKDSMSQSLTMLVISNYFLVFILPFGIILKASVLANMDHQSNCWKLLLSKPISKTHIYLSKFIILFFGSMISAFLLFVGNYLIAFSFLPFGSEIPLLTFIKQAFYPYLASIPIMAFQLYLSILIRNQAYPIIIGAVGVIAGLFFQMNPLTQYLFWAYPSLVSPIIQTIRDGELGKIIANNHILPYLSLSVFFGIVLLVIGLRHFSRREIA